jgi:hypothetical protein
MRAPGVTCSEEAWTSVETWSCLPSSAQSAGSRVQSMPLPANGSAMLAQVCLTGRGPAGVVLA